MVQSGKGQTVRVVFHVPGKPVPKARPRVTKKGYAYTPRTTQVFEQAVKLAWRKSRATHPFPEGVPLSMEITFNFAPPKSWSKKRRAEVIEKGMCPTCRPDLDNLMKGVADALNGLAYKDDGQIVAAVIRKKYARKAHTRVVLEELEMEAEVGK